MEFWGEVSMRRLKRAIRPGVWVAAVAMLVTGGIVATPATTAMAASGCVTQTFTTADQGTVLTCVKDAQVLLNNLHSIGPPGFPGLQNLTVDGSYGQHTAADVRQFQKDVNIQQDSQLGPQTWWFLCVNNGDNGFRGTFWHDAGCATEGPNPPP
jgi:putative peptidoglycan binding protein